MKKWIISILGLALLLGALSLNKNFQRAIALIGTQPLKGTVIVIDPGHGGKDPGARAGKIDEDILNLDISLKLKEFLVSGGATVILTRDNDYDLAPEGADNIKRADMKERALVMNSENVTLFISIHGNISLDRNCHGAEVYYRANDETSQQLAQLILERLRPISDSRFQPKKGDFYLLNNTTTLGVLVETGFLSNSKDLANLQNKQYQEDLAYAIFQGINDFLKILQ